MGRKRQLKSLADYDRAVRNRYGVGSGSSYKSWLTIRDAGKRGRRTEICGTTIDRIYNLLSDGETGLFPILEKTRGIIDIREQFPLLPLDVAQGVAERYGIRYPIHVKSRDPAVLSTDFLVTVTNHGSDSFFALAVKDDPDLRSLSVLKNLEIERLFWAALDVPWRLILKSSIDPNVVANLSWISNPLRESRNGHALPPLGPELDTVFVPRVHQISSIIDSLSHAYSVDGDGATTLLCQLIWDDVVEIDLRCPIEESGLIRVLGVDRENYFAPEGESDAAIA